MLHKIGISIALNAVALYATVELLEEVSIAGGIPTYIWAGLVFGVINGILKPFLKAVTFPLKYLTLGLSLIAINIVVFYLGDITLEHFFGLQYDIIVKTGLVSYIKVGILFGAINWIEHLIIK